MSADKTRCRGLRWIAGLTGVMLAGALRCDDAQEFRAAASDSLQSGLTTIATGLIDGLFAVWEPDSTTDSTTDTSSSS